MTAFKAGLLVPWFRVISEWVVFGVKGQLITLFLDILDIAVIRAEKHCSTWKTTGFRFLGLELLGGQCMYQRRGEFLKAYPMLLNIDLFNPLTWEGELKKVKINHHNTGSCFIFNIQRYVKSKHYILLQDLIL